MAQVIYLNPERVKQLRLLRRLSQEELAKLAGLNKQTIYRLEKGAILSRSGKETSIAWRKRSTSI